MHAHKAYNTQGWTANRAYNIQVGLLYLGLQYELDHPSLLAYNTQLDSLNLTIIRRHMQINNKKKTQVIITTVPVKHISTTYQHPNIQMIHTVV